MGCSPNAVSCRPRSRAPCQRSDVDRVRTADAVRREAAQAVAYWWGVTGQTLTVWRKALGVQETNERTSALRSAYTEEAWAVEARRKAHSKNADPERRAKIAAAKRGKPRPPHVVEAIRRSHLGRHHSEETRQKMR